MQRIIRTVLLVVGMVFPPHQLLSQSLASSSLNVVATPVQSAPTDSIVQLAAEAKGLQLVPPDQLQPFGTFWWVQPGGFAAPAPCPPQDLSVPIYQIAEGQFLVDETYGQLAVNASQPSLQSKSTVSSALETEATAVVNLITKVQATATRQQMLAMGMDVPSPAGGFGDGGGEYTNIFYSTFSIDTNGLWLEITNVSNGWSYLNLHNATNQVYAIWSTTALPGGWQVETEVWPTDTNCMPFTVQNFDRQNLFLRAEDWTGVTENGNTTPDWWLWMYFGTTALSDTNLDADGNTLLSDYQSGTDPNVINFSLTVTNIYFNSMSEPVQLNIVSGTPNYYAVSVDDPNYEADASWQTYAGPNVAVNLGLTQGWHDVWVGMKGRAPNSTVTWQWVRLKLDLTPPLLVITGPSNNTVSQPVVQLTGFSPEALASISYDLTNANGLTTAHQILVIDQYYDTNNWEFMTNTFQAFDVLLTNGVNSFTLHATDLAGNVTTTNFSLTLDYSSKTNPPVVQLNWPQNGMKVCGGNFTCNGSVSDPTASVTAQKVDTNGIANVFNALVGRDGRFYISDLPLNSGTNVYTLTVTDVASNVTTTNLTVIQGDAGLTIDPISANQTTVTGEINVNTFTVWVNGLKATMSSSPNGNGIYTWEADHVPIPPNGSLVQVTAIPNSDNGGYGSWSNGGGQ